jgi:YggT family protein
MTFLPQIYWFISNAIIMAIVAVIALVVLRLITDQANPNPFGWTSRTIRRLTDPIISPLRRALVRFGVDPKYAPLVTILITILLGWFLLQLVSTLIFTLTGVTSSLAKHAVAPMIGYLLFGLLGFYTLLIFMRVVFSWVMIGYSNRLMRFLVNTTEPMLAPLRRMVPLIGGFDLSPIVALFILRLLQEAIAGTLIRG